MDFLTQSPSDILRHIVSFLLYTPDTARLSRVNRALDRTPRLYPASAHQRHHNFTPPLHFPLPKTGQTVSCRWQDGQMKYPLEFYSPHFLTRHSKVQDGVVISRYTHDLKQTSTEFVNDGGISEWVLHLSSTDGSPQSLFVEGCFYLSVLSLDRVYVRRASDGLFLYFTRQGQLTCIVDPFPRASRQVPDHTRTETVYNLDERWVETRGKRRKLTKAESLKLPTLFQYDMGIFHQVK
jgi:hypothetical protein